MLPNAYMKTNSLRTRFVIAGCLLLAFTVVCGAWSVFTFHRLGDALGRTLDQNQETINVALEAVYALEREDDALLVALNNGGDEAAKALRTDRDNFEKAYRELRTYVRNAADEQAYKTLRIDADAYRQAGDSLMAAAGQPDTFRRYSKEVNPLLWQAIARARYFREVNVKAMRAAGIETEADAEYSSRVVTGITLAACILSAGVVVLLTRNVTRPIAELDRAVEAIRQDKLDYRVHVHSSDELGRLAAGFNRMADDLEDSRREIEERFRQMADNIHEIFWVRNPQDGRILYVSPGYEEVWGRTCQSLYEDPRSWVESVHEDDKSQAIDDVKQQDRGVFHDSEFRLVRPDGSIRWIRSRAFPLKTQNGEMFRVAGLAEDITERKRIDAALRKSEERFRYLVQNSSDIISLFDAEGTILYQAPSIKSLLGHRPEDRVGKNVFRDPIVHPDDIERKRAFFDAIRSQPGTAVTAEFRLRHADGSWRNIEGIGQNFLHDATVAGIVTNYRDITDRKRAEEELRASEERWRSLTEALPQLVWTATPDGACDYFSTQWTEYTGVPESRLLDWQWLEVLHPDDREPTRRFWMDSVEGRGPYDVEYRVRRSDGEYRWFKTRGVPIRENSHICKWFGTCTDITDAKQAEEELRLAKEAAESANRAKDEFLANVSHEIRTPMNAILGMTELALDTPLTEDQRQYLKTVKSAADNLLGIINDLLDFSKIEAGKLELDSGDFSLRATVGETLRALAVRAHKKGLELIYEVQSEVPDCLVGDLGRLRQVLLNLVGNAIKFTTEGEVVVRVEVADDSPPDGEIDLRFIVRDTGIGIPRDRQQAIFRAFEQEDSSTTRKFGGTGLGLTIASKIVELMGGQITVQSESGKGSVFTFTARFGVHPRPDESGVGQPPVLLRGLRVLVVDDNATNRHILEEWLRGWQMDAAAVSDGVAALDALWDAVTSKRPYELVMLDARMPDTDGLAIAEMIRKRQDLASTRLILLTSGDRPGDIAQYRQLRINAHLLKPVQQDELLETIYRVMSGTNGDSQFATTSTARQNGANGALTPMRVLVAEDNEFNAQLLELLLTRQGHEVQIARNGVDALALASERDFDLLLLDIHMPEMDGFQVIRAIRERESESGQHLPVIALTARSRKEDRELCLASGMDDFLVKPLRAADLKIAMGRLTASAAPSGSEKLPREQSEYGVLDSKMLLSICGGDGQILAKISESFRNHLPLQLTEIGDALRENDAPKLREAAHRLSGMVLAFSTIAGNVSSQLEELAANDRLQDCPLLFKQLEELARELLKQLDGISIDVLKEQAATPAG
jgi:two-component system sensor histidine kinase/response regulator